MKEHTSSQEPKNISTKTVTKANNWDGFTSALNQLCNSDDFLSKDERKQPAQDRDPLEGFDKP